MDTTFTAAIPMSKSNEQPDPDRLIELLTDAADTWVSLADSTGWTDLFGHWRGTADLLEFAAGIPTRASHQLTKPLPGCVVFVEFARWAVTANAPPHALKALQKQAERVVNVDHPEEKTKPFQRQVQAIAHSVLAAAVARTDGPRCLEHLADAAELYDKEWSLTELRTARSPDNPVTPASAVEDKQIRKNKGHLLLDLARQCGAFGNNGVSISTWLVLHHLLSRIFGQDNQLNISDNETKVLMYQPEDRRGQISRMTFELVNAPESGVYLDPLAFGITRIKKSMRNSLRIGFRCCRRQVIDESASIRVSGILPLTVYSLGGSSAGGMFSAAMVVTAGQQSLDSTRSATCRLVINDARLAELENVPLDTHDVKLGSVGGFVRKINEARQRRHGIEEVFLCESDESVWSTANPGRRRPRVTGVQTLQQLIDGLTANQNFDRELDRHAQWVHEAWDRVRDAIRNDIREDDRDHRFDCYIEPTFRIEGPLKRLEMSTDDLPAGMPIAQTPGRMTGRDRDEFPIPGDSTLDRDEQLLNLLEFSLRGGSLSVSDNGPPLPAWLKPHRPIVIYDNAGAGKTVCSHRLRHLLTDPQYRERLLGHRLPPLVIRLDGRWRREENDPSRLLTIRQLLVEVFAEETEQMKAEHRALVEETVAHALRESRVMLILDGFDQFPPDDRQHVVTVFTQHEDSKHCRWIITSRVHTIDELRSARKFFRDDEWTCVRIDPFAGKPADR